MEINYTVLSTFVRLKLFIIQGFLLLFVWFLKCNYLDHIQKKSPWEAFPKAEGQPLSAKGLSYFDKHFLNLSSLAQHSAVLLSLTCNNFWHLSEHQLPYVLQISFQWWSNEYAREECVCADSSSGRDTRFLDKGAEAGGTHTALWPRLQWGMATCWEGQPVTSFGLCSATKIYSTPTISALYCLLDSETQQWIREAR